MLRQRGRDHVELAVDGALAVRTFERHIDVEFLGRLLGAQFHGLPELMLEALRDESDIRLVCCAREPAGAQ